MAIICKNCGTENPLGAKFCINCGAPLGEKIPQTVYDEKKYLVIFFSDVVNYTGLSEKLSPSEVKRIVDEAFGKITSIIEKYGGSVNKYIGDAILAVWGLPKTSEEDVYNALRASLEIREFLKEYDKKIMEEKGLHFRMRIAVHYGEVVAGKVADTEEYTILGDAVNTANRIEELTLPGEIFVSYPVYAIAKDRFKFKEIGKKKVKGKTEEVYVWQLIEEGPTERYEFTKYAPVVFKERYLNYLEEVLNKSLEEGRPYGVVVWGEPGVGKSLIVENFLRNLRVKGIRDKLEVFEIDAYGMKEKSKEYTLMDEIKKLLGGEIEEVASKKPVLGIIHNAEDMDDFTRDKFLKMFVKTAEEVTIASFLESKPIVIIFILQTFSPNTPLLQQQSPQLKHFKIEPFDKEETEIFLKSILDEVTDEQVEFIYEATGGNPAFINELLNEFWDLGYIKCEEGKVFISDLPSDPVPPVKAFSTFFPWFDQLSREEKDILEIASLMGEIFWREPILNIKKDLNVPQILANLGDKGFVEYMGYDILIGGYKYRFATKIFQKIIEKSILSQNYNVWVKDIFSWLKDKPLSDYHKLRLLRYFTDFGEYKESFKLLKEFSKIPYYREMVLKNLEDLLDKVDEEDKKEIYYILGKIYVEKKDFIKAEANLRPILDFKKEAKMETLKMVLQGWRLPEEKPFEIFSRYYASLAEGKISTFEELDVSDKDSDIKTYLLADLYAKSDNLAKLREVIFDFPPTIDYFLNGYELHLKSIFDKERGDYETAFSKLSESFYYFNLVGDKWGIARSYLKMAEIYQRTGNIDRALNFVNMASTEFSKIKNRLSIGEVNLLLSEIYYLLGSKEMVKSYATISFYIFKEYGEEWLTQKARFQLIKIEEDVDKALNFLKEISEKGNIKVLGELNCFIGRMLYKDGRKEEALEKFKESENYLKFFPYELHILYKDYGKLLIELGEIEEGEKKLKEAKEFFLKIGNEKLVSEIEG